MDASAISQIIFLIILLILSAFFSSAETALTTVNKIRMRTLADDGNRRAERVLRITDDSHKMLSAILIGNNIVNLSASSLATTLAIKLWGSVGAGIATGILTFLILVFGEISPKTFATLYADQISIAYSGIIDFLMKILTPVIFLVNWFFQGATNQPAIWRIEIDAGYVADSVLIRLHIRGELQPKFLVSIRV